MSMPFEDPLTTASDDTTQTLKESDLYRFSSVNDANENVVDSKSTVEKILEPEKIFDFLVWNHKCNEGQANRIYEEMEKLGLRGYIYDRDKIAGQYKLTAVEQAIRSTESIILLISKEALTCSEFSRKMHASSNYSVIPIYIDVPRSQYPRPLRHHVDIRYKNDAEFWVRLHAAITRPKKECDGSVVLGNISKPFKKESSSSQESPLPRKKPVKPIKMVPIKSAPPLEKQSKKSPPSSKKKSWLVPSFLRSKQSEDKKIPSPIPMKPMGTKRDADLDNGAFHHSV